MEDLWTYLKEEYGKGRPIVLYGTGDGADKILARLEEDNIEVSGVFASDGFVRDRSYRGMKVESFDALTSRLTDPVVLVSFGSSRPEVISAIDNIDSRSECYAPDVPVCGGEVFDKTFFEKHKNETDEVYSLLADDPSRICMDSLIKARLTGKISYLHDAECTPDDIFSLIDLPDDAVFFDLGAYNGDTVREYLSRFPSIKDIVAVEPEPHNHKKLEKTASEISSGMDIRVISFRALISDSCHESSVTASARGRGTRGDPVHAKTIATDAVTVDHLVEITDFVPDLIKFDIEGFEAAGIRGAEKTIRDYRPIMRIACYHKSEDIFRLPLEVLKINSSYKIYMRHLPSIPGWDTDFIFI